MVNAIFAVCKSDPDVAVTVTVAVVGGGGFVLSLLPPPPHADNANRQTERRIADQTTRRRFFKRSRQLATTKMVSDKNGLPDGYAFDADAPVAIVSCVVIEFPDGVTLDGLKAHVAPAGRPAQEKVTAELNPFCGVMVRVIAP